MKIVSNAAVYLSLFLLSLLIVGILHSPTLEDRCEANFKEVDPLTHLKGTGFHRSFERGFIERCVEVGGL